jgi:uncharacterized protein YbaR (Trm112 family)
MNDQSVVLDPELVAMLANPLEADRPPLVQKGEYLVCTKTGVGFPIVDGIPHLLPEDVISAEDLKTRLG